MKKLLLLLVALFSLNFASYSRDTYSRDSSVLPKAAQATISKNFKAKVSVVKIDKDFGRISEYEAILTDGTEITFDRHGNWENIETSASNSVPSALIPKGVASYVKKNHPGLKIVGIDKERSGYDIELSNGIEIKFDKQGQFLRYDD